MADDNVQHGIDDNPHGDAGKGAVAGALGGAAVGALAGGPVGAVIGAVAGAIASGAAVAAVDAVDNDDTVSGLGEGSSTDANRGTIGTAGYNASSSPDITPLSGPDITTVGGTSAAGTNPPDIRPVSGTGTTGTTGADQPDITPLSPPDITAVGGTTTTETDTVAVPQSRHEQTRADVTPSAPQSNATPVNQTGDHIVVPVIEEQLNVRKSMQQTGEVDITKHVVTEQVNVPVEVSREEVVVTRHAVDRNLQPGEEAIGQGEELLRIPVMEETVAVTKQAHVVEELEIGKERITEHENVSDTVRKEVVDINDTTGQIDTTRNNNR